MSTALIDAPPRRRGSDFADLSQRIKRAGLLRRRPGHYATRIILTTALLVGTYAGVLLLGASWWQLGLAAVLAVLFTQIAFVGHDIGHRQVFRSRKVAEIFGLVLGNFGLGMSQGWWVDKHNRHHSHPNEVGKDPDIAKNGAIVWTDEQNQARRGIGRLWARWQGRLFLPLLLLEGLNLRVSGFRGLRERPARRRWLELALLLAHVGGYLTLVFLAMSPLQALAFIAVHQGLFGVYMGLSFAPNHKGMPILPEGSTVDFLRRQVLTSRNVRGGPVTDLVLGGLNYQIEHHLFPSMPRPALRRAQPIVQQFCAERGISYEVTGPIESYRQAFSYLHHVGQDPH